MAQLFYKRIFTITLALKGDSIVAFNHLIRKILYLSKRGSAIA